MSDHLDPQPPPTPGHGDVWRDVIDACAIICPPELVRDMAARRRQGLARYGTPLQYDNGRDAMVDAYQEYLDGVAYVHQARAPWWLRWLSILMCALIRWWTFRLAADKARTP